ncbi:MMPL family transporter [Natronosporangium hydrolyticum]|uniref:MMPL family transporter n=1 Tax=Natronosporangium hydrolyticum TaxID=2811111 RepID=A0A895YI54_9ACTN|nr:MMPL family transporter [Natronosporangium hydrolyticum]
MVARGLGWLRRPLVWAAVVTALWIIVGGPLGSYQGRLAEVQENDTAAFLPADAEATQVAELDEDRFAGDVLPAVVVFERDDGLTESDLAALTDLSERLGQLPQTDGEVSPPIPSDDGVAAQVVVPLADNDQVSDAVQEIRELVGASAPAEVTAYLTGPAGFATDLGSAFGDIDTLLLAVTAAVVAVILVIVYRSPILPLVVLLGAGLALGTASAAVYALARADLILLNGQSQGIMLILVFGAATDYALLMVARYREELRNHQDRVTAIRVAWRRAVGPILASGSTVILALLALLLSELNSNRGLGPVAAIGVTAALLVMLTYLPAILLVLGRVGFWPFQPRYGTAAAERRGAWEWLANLIGRRARLVWVLTLLVLAGFAAMAPQFKADGVPQTEFFLGEVEAVTGQEVLGQHFPAGAAAPTIVIANVDYVDQVVAAVQQVPGVAEVRPDAEDGDLARISVTLAEPADSEAAIATIDPLRDAVRGVDGAEALVGGQTAVDADTRVAAERDRAVIIPIALAIVFVIIAWLLRAVVVTALLLASVVLSFLATLGASALVFNHVFNFPGADPSVPLFAFIFLVALGVDYSIFLLTRVREEAGKVGTREGVRIGLSVTGRVITSAGVVLAATFSALSVIPILFLAQIAFIVALGVLVDTMVVRSLLIPGLCHDIGRKIWWPSRPDSGHDPHRKLATGPGPDDGSPRQQ